MGEAKRREDMKAADDASLREAAIYMLMERAKRNVIAKARQDGVDLDAEDFDLMSLVLPPEHQIKVAIEDVRSVLAFFEQSPVAVN